MAFAYKISANALYNSYVHAYVCTHTNSINDSIVVKHVYALIADVSVEQQDVHLPKQEDRHPQQHQTQGNITRKKNDVNRLVLNKDFRKGFFVNNGGCVQWISVMNYETVCM